MSDVSALLSKRLGNKEKSLKMAALAQKSAKGDLNGFAGIFGVADLKEAERAALEEILHRYATKEADIARDLHALSSITSEVKAITSQAMMLHGERIKRAHAIFTRYREGAFSAWLVATYGNRQTPYNFWHYYEFCQALPKELHPQLEAMPRQAVYTLASREGPLPLKEQIVKDYAGQTKGELLCLIRSHFPLAKDDKRAENPAEVIHQQLQKIYAELSRRKQALSEKQKKKLGEVLYNMLKLIQER